MSRRTVPVHRRCQGVFRVLAVDGIAGILRVVTCSRQSTGRYGQFHIFYVFSAMLAATVDTGFTSSVEDFGEFPTFIREKCTSDPQVHDPLGFIA